jgi:hypothetical protein
MALFAMSLYVAALNRYDEARECARESLSLAREYQLDVHIAWTLDQLATISVLRPKSVHEGLSHAVRILGFVDARIAALGSARLPFVQSQYESVCETLRVAMGADVVADLMREGATMAEVGAVERALAI